MKSFSPPPLVRTVIALLILTLVVVLWRAEHTATFYWQCVAALVGLCWWREHNRCHVRDAFSSRFTPTFPFAGEVEGEQEPTTTPSNTVGEYHDLTALYTERARLEAEIETLRAQAEVYAVLPPGQTPCHQFAPGIETRPSGTESDLPQAQRGCGETTARLADTLTEQLRVTLQETDQAVTFAIGAFQQIVQESEEAAECAREMMRWGGEQSPLLHSALAHLAEKSDAIGDRGQQIVTAFQFHDLLCQRLQSVIAALATLAAGQPPCGEQAVQAAATTSGESRQGACLPAAAIGYAPKQDERADITLF